MINIYQVLEDIRCTEHHEHESELKEMVDLVVSEHLSQMEEEEYQYLSDSHIDFQDEDEDDILRDKIEEEYQELIDRLEEE